MAEETPVVQNEGIQATEEPEAPAVAQSSEGHKRKFEDATPEEAGAGTPAEELGVYSNVPPPVSDFDMAKQKAAELAAKFSADGEAKRLKTENGEQDPNGPAPGAPSSQDVPPAFDGPPQDADQSSQQAYGDYQADESGTITKKIDVPNSKVGLVIGKQGETIKYLQQQSGARIQVTRDADTDPMSQFRPVELMGTAEQIKLAEKLVNDVITEQAGVGGSGALLARGFGGLAPPGDSVSIKVPNNKVGLIIGRGGETIKNLQSRSGARIQVQSDRETEPGATERVVTLIGNKRATDMAAELIAEVVDENRPRGAPMFGGGGGGGSYGGSGGGGGGYRQSQWGGPSGPPMQQGGYSGGYQQPSYQGPPQQQYGAPPQQQYGGYPQQQQASGFQSGWDQRAATPAQPVQQQAGYGYYGQQSQAAAAPAAAAAAPADSTYAYGQQNQAYYGYQQQQPAATDASYQQQGYAQQQQAYAQPAYGGQQQPQQQAAQQTTAAYNGYSYPQQAAAGGDQTAYAQQGWAQTGYAQPAADGSAAAAAYDYGATSATGATAAPTGQA